MARVVLDNVSKIFPRPRGGDVRAVTHLSLAVEDKEFLVLVGPSGCGKTTTLRLIAGLDQVTSGTISIDGQIVNDVEPRDRDIAMVFQNYALYPHMTVFENMAFGLKLRKVPRSEIESRIAESAEMLGLRDCLDRLPRELSGGQRQRTALGRALVRKPRVLLLDEPLSNLDAPMRAQMRRELSRIHRQLASTMIYVTHDQAEAMTLGGRVAVMHGGVLQQVDTPRAIYREPGNMFVAGFIGSPPMNFLKGVITRRDDALIFQEQTASEPGANRLSLRVEGEGNGCLNDFAGKQLVLGIRPENIIPANDSTGVSSTAVVEAVEPFGADTHLYLSTPGHAFLARARAESTVHAGEKIAVTFDMRHAHFFDPNTEKRIL